LTHGERPSRRSAYVEAAGLGDDALQVGRDDGVEDLHAAPRDVPEVDHARGPSGDDAAEPALAFEQREPALIASIPSEGYVVANQSRAAREVHLGVLGPARVENRRAL
jgi:hypothetical protein